MDTSKQGAAISPVDGKVMGAVGVQSTASPALTGLAIAGSSILLVSHMFTLVWPVWKEGSVGDLTVYAYIFGLFNGVAWVLYAAVSLPTSLPFLAINGVGVIFYLFYVIFYLWFATGKKRAHALILLLTVVVVSGVMASLVKVMKSKQVNNMNPIKPLLSLFNGCTWIAYAFMSVPVNFYVVVPNLIGLVAAVFQIAVYLVYRSNSIHAEAVDYGHEMRDLSTSPV